MTPATYDLPRQYGGDTTHPVPFAFSIDLTGITAEFALSLNKEMIITATIGNGLSLSGNTITLEPFVAPNPQLSSDIYLYDLRLTFPDGAVRTYLTGQMPVQRNRA
ncbi:hypothetical protein [Yoonia sp.]|jgi:hypothetical protein|uniref:hypothetical protein n=1 Tax=Yoonia sp. TaxID=2212373 RepID=UPI0025EA1148|nr:hypothetical protein [Yoonia sp.]